MLNEVEWIALGVAATLVCALVANRIGLLQIGFMRKAHDLTVKKATPKINSRMEITPFHPVHRPDVTRYAVNTTIYNDGDLVARNLEGEWKLTASHGISEATDIIRIGSLPSFMPFKLEYKIVGNVPALWTESNLALQVDIKLNYLGFDDLPQTYRATYDYEFQNRRMIQRNMGN
ncbi:MAG: hypothetical protein ACRD59_11045 [Candidatus Acidiferrales bacterium]